MNHTSTLRRGTAAVLAGALLLSFAGCADNQTNEGTDIPMENLAYGATLREDTSHDFTIEYDKRFLEQDELDLLFSYYDSIQKQDVTEFTSCIVDFYLDYIIENMYGGLLQSDAYLTKVHDAFQTAAGGDFTFSYLQITDCKDENSPTSGVDYLKDMFNTLQGEDYWATHVRDCKALTTKIAMTSGDKSVDSQDMTVYLVNLDGTLYVCP